MAITQHLSHVMQQLMGNEIAQMGSNQPSKLDFLRRT